MKKSTLIIIISSIVVVSIAVAIVVASQLNKSSNTINYSRDAYNDVIQAYSDFIETRQANSEYLIDNAEGTMITLTLLDINSLRYAYYDVDGNGVEELFIADKDEIIDVYSYDGKEPQRVLTWEYYTYLFPSKDNLMVRIVDRTASGEDYILYEIDGCTASLVDSYTHDFFEIYDGIDVVDTTSTYYHGDQEISKEDYLSVTDDLLQNQIQYSFEWTYF